MFIVYQALGGALKYKYLIDKANTKCVSELVSVKES